MNRNLFLQFVKKNFIFFGFFKSCCIFGFIIIGITCCQNTKTSEDANLNNNNITPNTVVEDSTEKHDNDVAITISETLLYSGQQAKITSELFQDGTAYATTQSDFSYRATHGSFSGDIYTSPESKQQDVIFVKHIPTAVEKSVSITIVSAPKLVVDISSVLSCGDSVSISPQVYIGDVSENLSPSSFQYASQKGYFNSSVYQCPTDEVDDLITISYLPLQLTKTINVSVKAKPILTVDPLPVSVDKDTTVKPIVYLKKAQNRVDINPSDLTFSTSLGRFDGSNFIASTLGKATITITHIPTGQKVQKTIEIKDSLLLKVDVASKEIENFATMTINPVLSRSQQAVTSSMDDFSFRAEKGSFVKNVYQAPAVDKHLREVIDTITVSHQTLKLEEKVSLTVKYSKFRTIETSRFFMPVPSDWEVINKELGFIATSYKGKIQNNRGTEIKALALSGFNFLEPQTVMVLFQQQGGIGKNMEKVGEDEVNISGQKITRILFESSSRPLRKSWWMIFKFERVMYLLTMSGEESFFNGTDSDANHILKNFQFRPIQKDGGSMVMSPKDKPINENFFALTIPETWQSGNIFEVFFASSSVAYQGEKVGLFIFAHRSREIQSMDLSLILLLFRQEIVKDPSMKISDEEELDISGIPAKMVVFSGGKDIKNKMWLIAIKHEYTGYVMVINGPQEIWDKNPQFAEKIKNSFKPKN